MTSEQLREYFPILGTDAGGGAFVYFDNSATSQRPDCVVEAVRKSEQEANANIHRAVYTLSALASDAYESGREAVRDFINAPSRDNIVFTSGATAAINMVAYSFGAKFIGPGSEIIVGEAEHHSNIVPWQMLAARSGARVVPLRCCPDGSYSIGRLEELINGNTRLVCLGHASNVLGVLNPVREYVQLCHRHNVPILLDGSQAVVHSRVDVQEMGCDFYVFSAHKVYGPTGVGVLYGRKDLLEQMPPFLSGGDMVDTVTMERTTFAPVPTRFEAGTQNINAVAAMPKALQFAREVLEDKELKLEFDATVTLLLERLQRVEGLKIYGNTECPERRLPIFSFTVDGVHHEDLAILLDRMGVAVRSGLMCAEPLMKAMGVTGMVRASLLPYNTAEEVEIFVKSLEKAIRMLK